jgi:hypothetical protein
VTLVTLPNVYCSPQDVFDYLGTEGGQLRLDDHRLASGQQITLTAAASAGDGSLAVEPLARPLLAGTVLEFDGGGLAAVVEVTLAATARTGDASLSVQPLASALPALASAADSGVNLALAARLVKACRYGTSQVKLYACGRYDDADLASCWSANRWATALAARWLCKRQALACPQGVAEDAEEALDELKQVNAGLLRLEDVPTRTAGWPFLSNVTIDLGYDYARVRVEQPLSELTPTQYPQKVDWNSALWFEF